MWVVRLVSCETAAHTVATPLDKSPPREGGADAHDAVSVPLRDSEPDDVSGGFQGSVLNRVLSSIDGEFRSRFRPGAQHAQRMD